MVNIEKVINVVDAVCDCIPVVSTLTNGAQLLYKLACKVDATANPVNATWRDDVKIHVMNKSNLDCLIGLVPIFGNLMNFVEFIISGLRDQLMFSVIRSELELVKLHLARHPLSDNPKAVDILRQSAFSSKPEVFKLILDSRSWNFDYVIDALRGCWCPNEKTEKNANLILDYCDKHFNSYIPEEETSSIIRILKAFIEAGMTETATRILNILPQCDFEGFKLILSKYSFNAGSLRPNVGTLTEDQIDGILNRCKPFKLKMLTEYCRQVNTESKNLEREVDSENKYIDYCNEYHKNMRIKNPDEDLSHYDKYIKVKLYKQAFMDGFYEIHSEIIQKLLDRVENTSELIDALSSLVKMGSIPLLEKFLLKYEDKLSVKEKLNIVIMTRITPFVGVDALRGLDYFFKKYNHAFTDDQCQELLAVFSNNKPFLEKILEIRPGLEARFGSQIQAI